MRIRRLAGDEGGAPGGAALLGVGVGEDGALVGDAVDVGRAVAHHAAVVDAGVPVADVVAEDDEDVGPLGFCGCAAADEAVRRTVAARAARDYGGSEHRVPSQEREPVS